MGEWIDTDDDTTDTEALDGEDVPDDEGEGRASLGEKVRDRLPDQPSRADIDSMAASAAEEFTGALASIIVTLLLTVSKLVPFSARFWHGLINAGYRGLHAKTGADAIGHILVGNEIKQVPLTYDYDKGRYENDYGDYWNTPSGADNEYRVAGKVPAVWASAQSNELGSHVQAEVAEVLDMGDNRPLVNADVDVVLDAEQAMGNGGGNGPAVADGGYQLQVDNVSEWVDEIVDLRHDAEARVVSMEKYFETYPSVVAPEEMKQQEWRGRMAEQDRDMAKYALYMLLIAGGIVAVATVGPPLINALFGGGGGGGGGSILPGMAVALGGVF